MFFEGNGRVWQENGVPPIPGTCTNCSNEVEFEVWGGSAGPNVGAVFLPKKVFVGKKEYLVVCPICSWPDSDITKAQVQALKAG